ncbi:MAG: septal ring lytic transglycosylase RlpA family protein [Candidatus Bipolaricaulota bacterium]
MNNIYLVAGLALVAAGLIFGFIGGPGDEDYYETGVASWYGPNFQGKTTASGETFDMNELTAAHKSIPFGTKVRVTDLASNSQVVVRINDRGPFIKGRIIDLSKRAAEKLGIIDSGTAEVGLQVIEWGDN